MVYLCDTIKSQICEKHSRSNNIECLYRSKFQKMQVVILWNKPFTGTK